MREGIETPSGLARAFDGRGVPPDPEPVEWRREWRGINDDYGNVIPLGLSEALLKLDASKPGTLLLSKTDPANTNAAIQIELSGQNGSQIIEYNNFNVLVTVMPQQVCFAHHSKQVTVQKN